MHKKFLRTSASLITLGSILLGGAVAPARACDRDETEESRRALRELKGAKGGKDGRDWEAEQAREAAAARSREGVVNATMVAAATVVTGLVVNAVWKKFFRD